MGAGCTLIVFFIYIGLANFWGAGFSIQIFLGGGVVGVGDHFQTGLFLCH